MTINRKELFKKLTQASDIDYLDHLERKVDELRQVQEERDELLRLIYNSAIGDLALGYKTDIESIANAAYQITNISAEQLHTRTEK